MGLFPFMTPTEIALSNRCTVHWSLYRELNRFSPFPYHPELSDFMDKYGNHFTTVGAFRLSRSANPGFIRDGVAFTYLDVWNTYMCPYMTAYKHITDHGYQRLNELWSRSGEHYELCAAFYQDYGWIPRWKKDDVWYGHIELLVDLEFIYEGTPEFPMLVPSETVERPKFDRTLECIRLGLLD